MPSSSAVRRVGSHISTSSRKIVGDLCIGSPSSHAVIHMMCRRPPHPPRARIVHKHPQRMHRPTPRSRRSYGIPNSVMLMLIECVYVCIVFGWLVILAAAAVAIGALALAVVFAALLADVAHVGRFAGRARSVSAALTTASRVASRTATDARAPACRAAYPCIARSLRAGSRQAGRRRSAARADRLRARRPCSGT
jgi:hypothetical protein